MQGYKGFEISESWNAGQGKTQLNAKPSAELLAERPTMFPIAGWNMEDLAPLLDSMLANY